MDDKKQGPGPSQGDKSACRKLAESDEKFEAERRRREEECKALSIRYSLPTLMGQWLEDYSTTEEKCKEYEKRRAACRTFTQKQNIAIDYLNKPVRIAKYENQMSYNMPIQIESGHNMGGSDESGLKFVLGVLIVDAQIDLQTHPTLDEYAEVSATSSKGRSRRNVFKCMSIQGETDETPVLYGEDFYIIMSDVEGPTLYLTGLVPHLNNFGETGGRIPMALTTSPDRFSYFHVIDPDADKMITLKGTPVKTFVRICIVQSYSNMLLAIDTKNSVVTSYCVDYRTHCYTYRDSRHRITSENFWKFVTQAIDEGAGDDDGGAPS